MWLLFAKGCFDEIKKRTRNGSEVSVLAVDLKKGLKHINSSKAGKTIEVFNLNHSSLKDRRRNLTIMIKNFKDGGISNEEIKYRRNWFSYLRDLLVR